MMRRHDEMVRESGCRVPMDRFPPMTDRATLGGRRQGWIDSNRG